MALDIGERRTGVAETDPMKIIASGVGTVETSSLIQYLKTNHPIDEIEVLVVGEPKRLHGVASDSEEFISKTLQKIQSTFPQLKIVRYDERFTSKLASQALLMSGAKKKDRQKKELIDEISAVIILQSYMDSVR